MLWRPHKPLGQGCELVRVGGGQGEDLLGGGQRVQDPGGVLDEARLQHLVRLVQRGEPHVVYAEEPLADELLHSARSAHRDLTSLGLDFVLGHTQAANECL